MNDMSTTLTTEKGFSLIELMIVVAIVAILAAVAYPSYISQIAKGRRTECRGALMQALNQQERYYSQFNAYVAFTATNAASAPIKTSSNDTAANSACTMTAVACGSGLAECVQMVGTMTKADPDGLTQLKMDSAGNKKCTVSGTELTSTASKFQTVCWPQ